MATFSFRGHKAHVSFTRNNRGCTYPQWDAEAAVTADREGGHRSHGVAGGGREARTARLHARQYITRVIQFVGIYCPSIPARAPPVESAFSIVARAFAVRSLPSFRQTYKATPCTPAANSPFVFMQFAGVFACIRLTLFFR